MSAKKTSKRSKGSKRSKRSSGKKSGGKKATARKGAGRTRKAARAKRSAAAAGPRLVKTGRGPTPMEVAVQVAALLRAGQTSEVEEKWLAPGIESVEGVGASMAWTGKKSVLAKYRGWEADHEIHEMKLEGPWVGATGFAVKYWLDATQKSTGQRSQMEEIAVYTVRNGRIVREEFHFKTGV